MGAVRARLRRRGRPTTGVAFDPVALRARSQPPPRAATCGPSAFWHLRPIACVPFALRHGYDERTGMAELAARVHEEVPDGFRPTAAAEWRVRSAAPDPALRAAMIESGRSAIAAVVPLLLDAALLEKAARVTARRPLRRSLPLGLRRSSRTRRTSVRAPGRPRARRRSGSPDRPRQPEDDHPAPLALRASHGGGSDAASTAYAGARPHRREHRREPSLRGSYRLCRRGCVYRLCGGWRRG